MRDVRNWGEILDELCPESYRDIMDCYDRARSGIVFRQLTTHELHAVSEDDREAILFRGIPVIARKVRGEQATYLRSSIVSNLVEAKGRETIELYELIRLANWWAEEDQHQHTLMIAAAIEALHTLEPLPWAEMDRNAINAYLGPPEYTNVAEERSTFSGSGVCVIHLIGQFPEGKADSFAAFSFSPRLTSGARLGLGVRSHGCRFPKMSGVFNFFNSSLFYLISQLIRHPSREFLFFYLGSLGDFPACATLTQHFGFA